MTITKSLLLGSVLCALAWSPAGCVDGGGAADDEAIAEDLGSLGAGKADGAVLREVQLTLGAGEIKRYRVTTIGVRASLIQAGDVLARLSAKHYEIDIYGETSTAPTVEAIGDDGEPRQWTLRVENLGDAPLDATLEVLEWAPSPAADAPWVGVVGEELRREPLDVPAGDTKVFRVTATRFRAALTQSTSVDAQLSAKHYDIDIYGEAGLAPTVDAIAEVDALRRWILRVTNLGDLALQGEVVVHQLGSEPTAEVAIISDIDKTLLPPAGGSDALPAPYPGVATLLDELESGGGGTPGDVHYVTARSEARVASIPEWMTTWGLPPGPISTGISGVPWIAQSEKVRDISEVFDARPNQRFVMLGDASHRDPEAYRDIVEKYPGRVVAGFIHEVELMTADRAGPLNIYQDYAQVAAVLFGLGVLDEDAARRVMAAAQDEGLAIDDDGIDALLDAQRPDDGG